MPASRFKSPARPGPVCHVHEFKAGAEIREKRRKAAGTGDKVDMPHTDAMTPAKTRDVLHPYPALTPIQVKAWLTRDISFLLPVRPRLMPRGRGSPCHEPRWRILGNVRAPGSDA